MNEKRCEELAAKVEESGQTRPEVYGDYKECLDRAKPQAAVVSTAWEKHLEITVLFIIANFVCIGLFLEKYEILVLKNRLLYYLGVI